MSDYDRNVAARGFGAARAEAIDAGLRAYMIRVYNYMAAGVALTGVVAWLTFNAAVVTDAAGRITGLTPFGQTIFSGPLTIVLFLGTLGLVFFMSFRISNLQPSTALMLFMVYAGLLGLMLSSVFLAYTASSVTRTFFISAALAGTAGLFIGLRFGKIDPFLGLKFGMKGLAIMIIGGLGNVYGSMILGVAIGLVEVLMITYFSSAYTAVAVWGLLILILIFAPNGLFGSQIKAEKV